MKLNLYNGGYRGEPTKCESCLKEGIREEKLKQIGI